MPAASENQTDLSQEAETKTEKPDDGDLEGKSVQHTAALSFGIFFVIIGLPLWWKTTEVYRVSLPYSDIQQLSEKKIEYLIEVNVIWAEDEDRLKLPDLAVQLNSKLGAEKGASSELSPIFRAAVRKAESSEITAIESATKVSSLSLLFGAKHLSLYNIVVIKPTKELSQPIVAPFNNIFLPYNGADVSSLTDQIVHLLKDVTRAAAVAKSLDVARGQATQRPQKDSMRSFRYHTGFDVSFTLMVPEPDLIEVQWDIRKGVEEYLQPLFKSLEEYTQFTVMSQVIYFLSLGGKPRKGKDFFYYEERDLPHVINPLESKLGSHASKNPGLNFIACIPPVEKSPLHIQDSTGSLLESNAFLSPRWGGVMIYNLNQSVVNEARRPTVQLSMHKIMRVFVAQIRLLLNIQAQFLPEVVVVSGETSKLHQWELAAWLRTRCVENLATSTSTLSSLAQLLEEIGNIVINDDIGRQVEQSVESIKLSHMHLAAGRLREAFLASRDALQASELAFFHPSLLELLYFPEDQKFAIYIPLFLPISIPVLSSTVQAIRWLQQKRKRKTN